MMKSPRRFLKPIVIIGLFAFWSTATVAATSDFALVRESKHTIVEATYQLSPPAVQFDETGTLHVGWFEKHGDMRALKAVRISSGGRVIGESVRVNPENEEPEALHQAPGLAVGAAKQVFMSWSTAEKDAGAMFATDLRLVRSIDGGQTFEPPLPVNDDGQLISHGFESLLADGTGHVSVVWLDNRSKNTSGAGAIFACSKDGGTSMNANLTIDGMACPCCRPMITKAPDGTVWVAWRKTFEGNVRDIVVARSTDNGTSFSPPMLVHKDGWAFPACPHRGPSVAFDEFGRLYVAWYTEGTNEQPRILLSVSDDQGTTFSLPISLHTSTTSLPDQLKIAVHPSGAVVAVWEEVTGVRKRTVMRVSMDRGRTFEPVRILSDGAKAETPTVAIHSNGTVALAWTEHSWPHNRLVVQFGTLIFPKREHATP